MEKQDWKKSRTSEQVDGTMKMDVGDREHVYMLERIVSGETYEAHADLHVTR